MKKRSTQPGHLRDRIKALRQRLEPHELSAMLITNPVDIRYLTGFVGDDSWALIPMRGTTIYVLSDFRFTEQIDREAPHVRAILRKKSLGEELEKLANKRGDGRIGLQRDHVTIAEHKALIKRLGAKRIKAIDDGLLEQRAIKSPEEIRAIRKALRIQQTAFHETCDFIEPGMTEFEACAFLEYRMRALGADGVSFPSIVAADANGSLPHAIPGKTKIKMGGTVLIDWGAKWGGYCSDLTRVIALGKMNPTLREIYQVCLDAQMAAIDAIGPGKPLQAIDEVARGIIDRAGYGDRFGHGLGHGIGLDVHEQPALSGRATGALQPGHVVTVEPGIYLPGIGGVRIEDDVLVTPRGRQVLSDLPKSLESAMI